MALDLFQYVGCAISDVIKLGPRNSHHDKDSHGRPISVIRYNRTRSKDGKLGPEANAGMCKALSDSIAACNLKGLDTWLVTERGKPHASPNSFGNKVSGLVPPSWIARALHQPRDQEGSGNEGSRERRHSHRADGNVRLADGEGSHAIHQSGVQAETWKGWREALGQELKTDKSE
jgi:hypothetical protein